MTPRAFPDADGGLVRSTLNWYNVLDYPSIQAAIDAVPADGGVVYIPASPTPYSTTTIPSYTPPIRLPANRAITLRGDGPYASILKSNDANADMIHMAGDYQTVEGLWLWGPGGGTGTGRGIRVWRDADYTIPDFGLADNIAYRVAIRDCLITKTASWGLYVDTQIRPGRNKTNLSVIGYVERVEFRDIVSGGHVYMAPPPANAGTPGNPPISGSNTTWLFHACHFRQINQFGFRAQYGRGLTLLACVFESNIDSPEPFVSLESCSHIRVTSCWFEGRATRQIGSGPGSYATGNRFFIEAVRTNDARYPDHFANVMIDNCSFFRGTTLPTLELNPRACYIGASARNVVFSGNTIESNRTLHEFSDSDPDSDAVRLDSDVQVSMLGGSFIQPGSSRPIHVREVSGLGKSALANNTWAIRFPKVVAQDYTAELQKFAREGDVIYDLDLHALRVCIGLSGGSPPAAIWKTIT